MTEKCTEDQFRQDIANHVLTIKHDEGVYRHLTLKQPKSQVFRFDLVTWPGYLTICGDMGEAVFSRVQDMFTFFRSHGAPEDPLEINPDYWAEKRRAAGEGYEYVPDLFREAVNDDVNNWIEAHPGFLDENRLREEVEADVLWFAEDGEIAARKAADQFCFGSFLFTDFWEHNFQTHTFRAIWQMYAIQWGIRVYDEAKR